MCTFLNVPLLDTNCSYQTFALHILCLRTLCSYSVQVEDIEHDNASIRDEFDAKMNLFEHIIWFLLNFGKLNTTEQVMEMTLMLK